MASFMENLKKAPVTLKIAIPVLGVTGLVQLIGMTTNYWAKKSLEGGYYYKGTGSFNSGLWKACSCFDECYCGFIHVVPDWLHIVRAFEVFGFLGVGLCLLLTAGLIFKPSNVLKVLAVLSSMGSGLAIMIGLSIYTSYIDKEYDHHYSYFLCGVAIAPCGVVFVLLLMSRVRPLVITTGVSASNQPPVVAAVQYQKGGYVVVPPPAKAAGV